MMQRPLFQLHEIIFMQGAGKAIVNVLKSSQAPTVIISALETLAALSQEEVLCMKHLYPLDIVDLILNMMKEYDWDSDIVEKGLQFIVCLTYFEDCVDSLAEAGLLPIVIASMEAHDDAPELLSAGQTVLTNLAVNAEEQEEMVKEGGLEMMLKLLVTHTDDDELLTEIITTLTRIACNDDFNEIVAEKGTSEIIEVGRKKMSSPKFLSSVFVLLGQLAFNSANLNGIIQYKGIQLLVDAVGEHPEEMDLVNRALQTIDNCATASSESAAIVESEGGKKLIEHVIDAYEGVPGGESIVATAKSALLGMNALSRTSHKQAVATAKKKN